LSTERVSRIIYKIGKKANVVVPQADEQKGKRVKYASTHMTCGGGVRPG